VAATKIHLEEKALLVVSKQNKTKSRRGKLM
jgi:hypothetical protein